MFCFWPVLRRSNKARIPILIQNNPIQVRVQLLFLFVQKQGTQNTLTFLADGAQTHEDLDERLRRVGVCGAFFACSLMVIHSDADRETKLHNRRRTLSPNLRAWEGNTQGGFAVSGGFFEYRLSSPGSRPW